jgi:hypothetical protein
MFRARTAGSASAVDSGRSYGRDGAVDQSRGFGVVMGTLARVVRLIVAIVVLTIVAGIVLVLLKANPTNMIVSDVHDAARWLAGPFAASSACTARGSRWRSTGAWPRSFTCSSAD